MLKYNQLFDKCLNPSSKLSKGHRALDSVLAMDIVKKSPAKLISQSDGVRRKSMNTAVSVMETNVSLLLKTKLMVIARKTHLQQKYGKITQLIRDPTTHANYDEIMSNMTTIRPIETINPSMSNSGIGRKLSDESKVNIVDRNAPMSAKANNLTIKAEDSLNDEADGSIDSNIDAAINPTRHKPNLTLLFSPTASTGDSSTANTARNALSLHPKTMPLDLMSPLIRSQLTTAKQSKVQISDYMRELMSSNHHNNMHNHFFYDDSSYMNYTPADPMTLQDMPAIDLQKEALDASDQSQTDVDSKTNVVRITTNRYSDSIVSRERRVHIVALSFNNLSHEIKGHKGSKFTKNTSIDSHKVLRGRWYYDLEAIDDELSDEELLAKATDDHAMKLSDPHFYYHLNPSEKYAKYGLQNKRFERYPINVSQ